MCRRNINLIVPISLVAVIVKLCITVVQVKGSSSNTLAVPGKVSKLFPFTKSRVWKISKNEIEQAENNETIDHFNMTEALFSRKEIEPALLLSINDLDNSGSELSSTYWTWTDLSHALGEDQIKAFLNTLPLTVLRNITKLTKINPQLGEKKLIELYIERNGKIQFLKNHVDATTQFNEEGNQIKNLPAKDESIRGINNKTAAEQLQFQIYLNSSSLLPVTVATSENLEAPKYQQTLPEPNNPTNKHVINDHPTSQLNTLTNSGYFLPDITTFAPPPVYQNPENYANMDMTPINDPINTFKPNVDDFLNPPVGSQELEFDYQQHSSSDIKLVPSASNTDGVAINEGGGWYGGNTYQEPQNEYYNIEQNPTSDFGQYYYEQQGQYDYSSPPLQSYSVPLIPLVEAQKTHQGYNPVPQVQYPPPYSFQTPTVAVPKNQQKQPEHDQPEQKRPESTAINNNNNKPPPHVEQPPSYPYPHVGSGGGGWGWGHNSDWGPSEIWNALKTYWKKSGKKSTAEKVFEVSIGILSFLAFGGYLLMLIYQVFAVTTTVPFFPLLTPTVPQNPTLFGLLFGRSLTQTDPDGSYRFNPNKLMNVKYIDELEQIVKTAMDRVKSEWSVADAFTHST